MMGFGAMGMVSWAFGAIAVATIWGGLWWLLSSIGSHSNADAQPKELTTSPPRPTPPASDWQQPTFEHPQAHATAPLPTRAKTEGDLR
ncbi:hypothetical protein ATK74_2530 [Propionicimonas paludicola]|uniref:Uncharacterized protein n=1 Tax=Propionicimonas paludicola TaxID=185243 RepID=A0A2A9CUZ0_9ACTN|nr:hypothetical protein [Propionicimonas paludicola]PFG17951.1 hypothetical protein ATK74_2530 [Propionicimonas paludicola]